MLFFLRFNGRVVSEETRLSYAVTKVINTIFCIITVLLFKANPLEVCVFFFGFQLNYQAYEEI